MFCIAAFIILIFMSIFSAKYRKLLVKSWGCVARRATFRPCDTGFKEELKDAMLARVAMRKPAWVRRAEIGIEIGSVLIILVTLWSLFVVVKSGLNLWVYGTCNPSNSSSCSLGAEACSIESNHISFVSSIKTFKTHVWVGDQFKDFGKTLGNIPTRLQDWNPQDYMPEIATYKKSFDASKPTALEVIDPGCQFCKQLFLNQQDAGFDARYNLTYIAYPIPSTTEKNGYKFPHSLLFTQYLEAMRLQPLQGAKTPSDWQMIERMFTWQDDQNVAYQIRFNAFYDAPTATKQIQTWAKDIGYSDDQVKELARLAVSKQVSNTIAAHAKIVETQIKTVKIPTAIYDGRRHDGVVSVQELK